MGVTPSGPLSGSAQADSHAQRSHHKKMETTNKSQSKLKVAVSGQVDHTGEKMDLSDEFQALRAEVIEALV